MSKILSELEPGLLWKYFGEILQVPRPSKKEERIKAFLMEFGKGQKLETIQDVTGNILIRKPATPGMHNKPWIVLQSHMDMVCEKNSDKIHDFEADAIEAVADGEWIKANGTTLGADDGIGMAAQLAILASDDIAHGPLECLFTVDEETGLTGAFGLKSDLLKGKILLNLDSEDEGQLFIGCAGGQDTLAWLPFDLEETPENHKAFTIKISGLQGGHSGDDINKGRGNANKIINRFLWEHKSKLGLCLHSIDGGNLRNAIAREASALILCPEERTDELTAVFERFSAQEKSAFAINEPGLRLDIHPAETPESIVDSESFDELVNALYACPHGVLAMSPTIENFVETSTNLASVKMEDHEFLVTTSQRSSVESSKQDATNMVTAVFRLAGGRTRTSEGYPGWTPNPNSPIVDLTADLYRKLFKQEPEVLAIHAGLECGLIGDKYPGMDMISFGPTIKGAHSPDERIHIESTQKFWDLLLAILKNIPNQE